MQLSSDFFDQFRDQNCLDQLLEDFKAIQAVLLVATKADRSIELQILLGYLIDLDPIKLYRQLYQTLVFALFNVDKDVKVAIVSRFSISDNKLREFPSIYSLHSVTRMKHIECLFTIFSWLSYQACILIDVLLHSVSNVRLDRQFDSCKTSNTLEDIGVVGLIQEELLLKQSARLWWLTCETVIRNVLNEMHRVHVKPANYFMKLLLSDAPNEIVESTCSWH